MATQINLRTRRLKSGKNEFDLDVGYFERKMAAIVKDLEDYTPEELHRELLKLAEVARKQINPL